jgi:hypothetical protein
MARRKHQRADMTFDELVALLRREFPDPESSEKLTEAEEVAFCLEQQHRQMQRGVELGFTKLEVLRALIPRPILDEDGGF